MRLGFIRRAAAGHTCGCTAPSTAIRSGDPGVLVLVGLAGVGRRPVGGYSLGMRQRLALGAALLGDPGVLVLDEPANGLDPEGIAWLRRLLREFASQGRTVLVSSHVLSEVRQLVDSVVIINGGRLVRQAGLADLAGAARTVLVRTPHDQRLYEVLAASGALVQRITPGLLRVSGLSAAELGRMAYAEHIELHGLAEHGDDLERVFLELTGVA